MTQAKESRQSCGLGSQATPVIVLTGAGISAESGGLLAELKPNLAHEAIARWQEQFNDLTLVT